MVEYLGTKFVGWQKQLKGKSIQKEIEKSLTKLLKQKTTIFAAGRTDKNAHAFSQSAHFDANFKIKEINKFIKSLNFF